MFTDGSLPAMHVDIAHLLRYAAGQADTGHLGLRLIEAFLHDPILEKQNNFRMHTL